MAKDKENRMLSAEEIKNAINKKTGNKNAYNLLHDNPTEVPFWIPSGCRLLDANMVENKMGGCPAGRLTMLCSESGVGKSFLALAYCKNAIDMGLSVVYFCSEPGGIEAEFLEKMMGKERMEKFIYVEVTFMEEVFETMESLMVNTDNKYFFVWDSLAATPSRLETEGGFDAGSYFAVAAKAAALGLKKLLVPLSKAQSTFLILNQVRANIGATKFDLLNPMTQYTIPGGKAVVFACSIVILLFAKSTKTNALIDESTGERIGKYGQAVFKKSRFRTEGRTIPIGFTWANGEPHIHNEELWFDALKERGYIYTKGPATYIRFKDKTEQKFKSESWMELLKDKTFYKKVDEVLDEAFIFNYQSDIGDKDNLPALEEMMAVKEDV